jgi:dihydroxy-acid dehydratase
MTTVPSPDRDPRTLRSWRWFGPGDLRSFGHRSRARQMGLDTVDWSGKPVIAILNTWSELNPCHLHFQLTAAQVKRGILQAGGMPVELPVLSLSESYMKPTTMLYRNLLAMEAEEVLRCHPVDGAVLLGGCDKTVPALIMGALSAGLPFVFMPAGPMLRGNWHGQILGSGSDAWKYWDEKRAGNLSESDWCEIEEGIARSHGTCMTMGTASTMAAIAETLGLTLPGATSLPAVDAGHARLAAASGRQAVENVWAGLNPCQFLTRASFENAIAASMALGGSTNAIIHLIAMAGRAGIPLPLDVFDQISRRTPLLADMRPTGKYLMEDFHYAGGLNALLAQLADLLKGDERTVNGRTLAENFAGARIHKPEVIRPRDQPVSTEGGTAVLRGSLAPNGAVIKHAAATARLLQHTGPAVVFRDYEDLAARLDDPSTPVTENSVFVLQNAGPVGAPGMPEWGMLPLPKRLLERGIRDAVRISDARMSGTSYGTCVLHVAPESAIGGPLALVRDGDPICLDVPSRRLDLLVDDTEMARRRAEWRAPARYCDRGYISLFLDQITQAPEGCDFRFLHGRGGVPEPRIH